MRKVRGRNTKMLGFLMTLPSSFIILLVLVYPFVNGVSLAFQDREIKAIYEGNWVGLNNFIKLFQDNEFLGLLQFSFVYTISVVAIAYLVGLMFAVLLNQKMFGRTFLRSAVILPWLMSSSIAATCWVLLFNDRLGFVNVALRGLGLVDEAIYFLANLNTVRVTVIMTGAWKAFPFIMVVILSMLQGVSPDLYESAEMDGANGWQRFAHITMPMIKSVSFVAVSLQFIWTFNNFDNIYLMTKGGPNYRTAVIPVLTYVTAFMRGHISYAAAIGVVLMVVVLLLRILFSALMRSAENEV